MARFALPLRHVLGALHASLAALRDAGSRGPERLPRPPSCRTGSSTLQQMGEGTMPARRSSSHVAVFAALAVVGSPPAPVAAQDSLVFTSLVAGWAHTCGLTKDGRAYCWGWNPAGALGNGNTVVSTTPVAVIGGLTFTALAASLTHTCGLAIGGAAYCWGENDHGQ